MLGKWLQYIGDEDKAVYVIKTTDGEKIESEAIRLKIHKRDVFFCTESRAKSYVGNPKESYDFQYIDIDKIWEYRGIYYDMWAFFDMKRKALLHYLCEFHWDNLFWDRWKMIDIDFNIIFLWILQYHNNEYLPTHKVTSIDFSDVLESLENERSFEEGDKYILYYPRGTVVRWHQIVILDDFYKLPEIKEAKQKYDLEHSPSPPKEAILVSSHGKAEVTGVPKISLDMPVMVNFDKQTIRIWTHTFSKFSDFFSFLGVKESKDKAKMSQTKWGIALIYAIVRYDEENSGEENMLVSDLLAYCKEFKKKRSHWLFEKQWVEKKWVSKTDCDSANSILMRCGLNMRLKLSDDKEEILIAK